MSTLLVDDNPVALRILKAQLANLDIRSVVLAQSGTEALALVAARPGFYTLLFCDLQMPGMDGVELLRHLADASFRGAIVLMSAEDERVLDSARALARARRLHVLGTLQKPLDPRALRAVLEPEPSRSGRLTTPREPPSAGELREAIETGQFVNYYQPKVSLRTGRVVGVEALVRWQHPTRGMVYPDQFIHVAESERALIGQLTQLVTARALARLREWEEKGLDLTVAVNVSMENLTDLAFPDLVAAAAHEAQAPLCKLVLEVTESRVSLDQQAPLEILTRLRMKRVGLAIDDFGTGHSSLAQLRDFPFTELKIDQSFVHKAWRSPPLRAIFDASAKLGSDLGLTRVAEGVEDLQDWAFVRASGCDAAQGYFIARPMPGDQVEAWVRAWVPPAW